MTLLQGLRPFIDMARLRRTVLVFAWAPESDMWQTINRELEECEQRDGQATQSQTN